MRYLNTIEINRSIEDIFAYISVQENHQHFVPQNKVSKQLTEGPMRVGAIVQNKARFMGMDMTETFEITEFVPTKLIAKRSQQGSTVETSDRFELEQISENNTRVSLVVTGNPKGMQKAFFFLLGPVVKHSFAQILRTLKQVLESQQVSLS